mgnify:CR=1 FL=1
MVASLLAHVVRQLVGVAVGVVEVDGVPRVVDVQHLSVRARHQRHPGPPHELAAIDDPRFDKEFLTGMIEHHSMAVMMAELCETRAVRPELLDLCAQIKATQMAEIELMQGWLVIPLIEESAESTISTPASLARSKAPACTPAVSCVWK